MKPETYKAIPLVMFTWQAREIPADNHPVLGPLPRVGDDGGLLAAFLVWADQQRITVSNVCHPVMGTTCGFVVGAWAAERVKDWLASQGLTKE